MEKTTIQITDEAWKCLNLRKERGDTFSDVIIRMSLESPELKDNNFMGDKD